MKKIISLALTIFLIFNLTCMSFAETDTQSDAQVVTENPLGINADSCILMEYDTKKVLYDKNGYNRMYPASTTKLMTAIIVLDKCKDLNEKVNISYYAVHSVPYTYSIANLMPEESFTIRDLMYALLVASANDAAYALAEYVANGGNNYSLDSSSETKAKFDESIETFSELMNKKAKSLGCKDTHFVNPNGIHNENHYSTAYDLTLIGKCAYAKDTILVMCNTLSYSLPNTEIYTLEERVFNTTNALLKSERTEYYEHANGLKTGYTDAALECIVASAEKNGRVLIATVLHAPLTNEFELTRERDCIKLFEYGFSRPHESTPLSIISRVSSPDGKTYLSEYGGENGDYMFIIWLVLGLLAVIFILGTIIFHKKR